MANVEMKTLKVGDTTYEFVDNTARNNKVDKVAGKDLSTNDYTTAEKTKLAGIETGAQKNTVTGVKGNAETSYRTGQINITPANIGLGKIENKTSEEILNELTKENVVNALGYEPSSTDTTYERATQTQDGLMSAEDKVKLDEFDPGAIGGVTGVKGDSETTYRTGQVNITKANIGLGNVEDGAQKNTITGVKGSSETSYRTGNVNITKANIGLGSVDNTADSAKSVASAAKLTTARTIALTGAVAGSGSFDGSGNLSIETSVSTAPTILSGTAEPTSTQGKNGDIYILYS